MAEDDKKNPDVSMLQSPPKRVTPLTPEQLMADFMEWAENERRAGRLMDVRLYSGQRPPGEPNVVLFALQEDLRARILGRFFLERLDTLSMLEAATYRYQYQGRWYGLGLINYLKDDLFWKFLWKRDFADQRQDVGDRIPSWIVHNHPLGSLQWRAYWIWTFFFRRTLCKMVISQLNQRNRMEGIPTTYRMAIRSDRDVEMLNEFGHVVNRKSIWDLQRVVRRGLEDYFDALNRGGVKHGLPIVCGAMLRYFLFTNGMSSDELKSSDFLSKWAYLENVDIPIYIYMKNPTLWTFEGFDLPTNVDNRPSRALTYATWYWETTLAIHANRPLTDNLETRLEEESANRSRKREREVRWYYYFNFPNRFRIRTEFSDFRGTDLARLNASGVLRKLPPIPHTTDQDSTKIFLGEPIPLEKTIECNTCGAHRAPFRCRDCRRAYYCSKKCHKTHKCCQKINV